MKKMITKQMGMANALQPILDGIKRPVAVFLCNMRTMADLQKKLKEYKDLEEQEKLIKLPCKVGDSVWFLDKELDPMEEALFEGCISGYEVVSAQTIYMIIAKITDPPSWLPQYKKIVTEDLGKTFFLSQEKAEIALKEWQLK